MEKAIGQMLDYYDLRSRFDETYIPAYWEQLMGKPIASRTQEVYVRDGKLYLRIESAPLRNELVLGKSKIIELLNREIGKTVIEEVIFI
jgi:predicted nucleic acid-binding Zn ribbon protein